MSLTINGNKLTWEDPPGKQWAVVGTSVVVPGPTDPPPTQPPTQPPGTGVGIWISKEEIMQLPMTGAAWDAVLTAANKPAVTPKLSDQDSEGNVTTLAHALAYARTGDLAYKDKALSAIRSLINTQSENGGRTLALGRELAAFVVAADLIGLDSALKQVFSVRLRELINKPLDGMTLIQCHEKRLNNWGTHAGASRAAVAAYLGDRAELDRCAFVFRGWLGDLTAYRGFKPGDLAWQADKANPVGINRPGAIISGHNVDGALPDEMRRAGGFNWPPGATGYAWGGMSGVVAQAEFLFRAGYPTYEWADRAILRAAEFLKRIGWEAQGDDAWAVAVINARCGTKHPVNGHAWGKNMGGTTWTHGAGVVAAADVIVVSETKRIATGETLIALQSEIDTIMRLEPEWMPTGNTYTINDHDDGELFAQDMERN